MSRQIKALSLSLAIGIGLLFFALSFALSSIWPAWESHGKLTAQLAELTRQRDAQRPAPAVSGEEQQAPTEEKSEPEKLPPGGKVQRLQQLIVGLGLNPDSIAYRKEEAEASGELGYHVSVPVKTTYPMLRKLLENVQTELPGVRLEKLSLQRTRASDAMLEVQLEFILRLDRELR